MSVMIDASVMDSSSVTQKHVPISPSAAVINVEAGLCVELEKAGPTREMSSSEKVMKVEGSPCLVITAVALA